MDGTLERRKYARLDLALTVSYRETGRVIEKPFDPREAVSSDLSMGGIRLMTPTHLENGAILDLEIILGEEGVSPISAEGEVIWQNRLASFSFETGVMIRSMPMTDKKRFMEFVFDQMAKLVS